MKIVALAFLVVLFVPMTSKAVENPMKYIAVKQSDDNRMFLYRCKESGNLVEIKQHYNFNSKQEEIQFIVNNKASEWITLGNNPVRFNELCRRACEESTARFVTVTR